MVLAHDITINFEFKELHWILQGFAFQDDAKKNSFQDDARRKKFQNNKNAQVDPGTRPG